jgi:Fic-DOC domain mobile mystery protein B
MKLDYPEGATPLDPNELDGLLLPLRTQGELNQAEQASILEARLWARRSRKIKAEILSVSGLLTLHRQMFSPVWAWAGKVRTTEKNLGVSPHQVQMKLHELVQNIDHRAERPDESQWPELAAVFHHTLVSIHAFPNGNGRHARLATEVLSWRLKQTEPGWGPTELTDEAKRRELYISALRQADRNDIRSLVRFMFP